MQLVPEKPKSALIKVLIPFCAEILQSNEIGMLVSSLNPVVLLQHCKRPDADREYQMLAITEYPGFGWTNLTKPLGLEDTDLPETFSLRANIELLTYEDRGGPLYTPLKYSSIDEAADAATRHLLILVQVFHISSKGTAVLAVHVKEQNIKTWLLNHFMKKPDFDLFSMAKDWTEKVYDDRFAQDRIKTLMQYPLARKPADSTFSEKERIPSIWVN